MPEFQEREAERQRAQAGGAGAVHRGGHARASSACEPLADDEIPVQEAYGNTVALTDEDIKKMPEGNRRRVLTFRKIREIADHA